MVVEIPQPPMTLCVADAYIYFYQIQFKLESSISIELQFIIIFCLERKKEWTRLDVGWTSTASVKPKKTNSEF